MSALSRLAPRSLQAKLISAFVALVAVALGVSGAAFVRLREEDQQREALDHVAAESSAISSEFLVRQLQGESVADLAAFARDAAGRHEVRILVTDRSRTVVVDSAGSLAGQTLRLQPESELAVTAGPPARPFVVSRPEEGTPGAGLLLLSSRDGPQQEGRPGPGGPGRPGGRVSSLDYQLILAVPEGDIAGAWLDLLPGLSFAGAIALPIAVLLAVLLARYITRPIRQLTAAAHLVSEGRFEVEVPQGRRDEVGQLAASFSTMTRRVGASQAQMRALVADVSHNLKTPLTSILGFSRALETGEATDPRTVERMGRVIHEEAGRLAGRLEDLLLLSELESGQAMLDRAAVDVASLVAGVARRVFPPGSQPQPSLELASGALVQADAAKLERAFENVLDNARKFTPPAGTIRVRCQCEPQGGVLVSVSNAAPGIDPEELPKLFDRFYRRDAARAARVSGSGLGLAIARDIVELHGGTLTASAADDTLTLMFRLR